MRYPESVTRSADILRQALPQMSRQRAALHPISYAVWYEHISGCNPALSAELQRIGNCGLTLDEAEVRALHSRHIGSAGGDALDEQQARRITEGLGQVLMALQDSALEADDASQRFDQALSGWAAQLDALAPSPYRGVVAELLGGTREMQAQVRRLRERLAANQQEIEALRAEARQARSEAMIDALTGLANRRAFDRELGQCLVSSEAGTPTGPCLVLGDIDWFKTVNDSLGHAYGDKVLREVAGSLRKVAHSHHLAARVGGEEFALLMPSAGLHEAMMLAETLREQVAALPLPPAGGQRPTITISLGVTQLARADSANDFFGRADQALYSAKRGGRNQVAVLAA